MSFTLVCVFINPIHKEQYDWEMVVNYAHTSRGCTISDAENSHYQACPTFNSSLQSFQGSYECSPTQLFPLLFIYLFFHTIYPDHSFHSLHSSQYFFPLPLFSPPEPQLLNFTSEKGKHPRNINQTHHKKIQ